MYTTKSSAKNVANESHQNAWERYRPMSTINFSDIVEDGTIYEHSRNETTFDPIETSTSISERATDYEIDTDAVSVDDILGNSIVHEIRHLSQSRHGRMSTSIRDHLPNESHSTSHFPPVNNDFSYASTDFRPAEEMGSQLDKDENEWEQEFADIPHMNGDTMSRTTSENSRRVPPKIPGKLANMTDFSMAYLGESISGNTDMSIGRYFLNRCQDLHDMIPDSSPSKHSPVALVSNSFQTVDTAMDGQSNASSTSCYTNNQATPKPKISSTTYNKEASIASVSAIATELEETDSPRTFLNKFYANKSKPLTQANVQLLEKSMSPQKMDKSIVPDRPVYNSDYRTIDQQEVAKREAEGMLNRMNSTKIGDNWRQMNSTDSTASVDEVTATADLTLGSNYSPIKTHSPRLENTAKNGKNKRMLSPNPVPTKNSPVSDQLVPHENTENDYRNQDRVPRRRRSPAQTPLEDVSSIMLNNLRITSPNNKSNSPSKIAVNLRKCETDLHPRASQERSPEQHRQYRLNSRSPDFAKLSLPSYGYQGSRVPCPSGLTLGQRCNSQMSTHSEYTQLDGKFPLKASTSELVWECVKLRKSVTKSFVIKNTSEKKLTLKIGVTGPGFQMSGADADSLVLQGNECRTINVTFCPTIIGKASGKVVFKPTKKNWPEDTERPVHLWAYGGSTVLQLQGVERGPVGSSFLKMGETSNITSTVLRRTFTIYNKGPLNGVATIFVKPKTNQYINENHITIEPNKCVIRPDCLTTVTVSYKLRRKDLERLRDKSCEVLTVGTLEVIFGSEPNRQRIASLLTRNGSIPSLYKQLEFLVDDFPAASMENFKDFQEDTENISELFGCFKTSEIALTINRTNLDDTRDTDLSGMDDSVLFRTMIEVPKIRASPPPAGGPSRHSDGKLWSIYPKRLSMDNRNNSRKTITITSFFSDAQTFQIDSNNRNYFNFSTGSGQIKANSEFMIDVELKKNLHIPSYSGVITIYFETDCIEVPVNVQSLP